MAGQFIYTIGDASQIEGLFNGPFLKGHREPRVAMVGRSNVGKSSLINALVGNKVAQVSNDPGKTRSIHLYLWKEVSTILADLPGYGYARTSATERDRWSVFIDAYLRQDPALLSTIVLLDARHGPTDLDVEAIQFLRKINRPIQIVFTKVDGLKTQAIRAARKKEASLALEKLGYDFKNAIWVSSKNGDGLNILTQRFQKGLLTESG